MKKIFGYNKTTTKANQELIKQELKENTEQRFYQEFNIFNLGEDTIHIRLNGGNWIELEAGEGFSTQHKVYKCEVQEAGAIVKYSGVGK